VRSGWSAAPACSGNPGAEAAAAGVGGWAAGRARGNDWGAAARAGSPEPRCSAARGCRDRAGRTPEARPTPTGFPRSRGSVPSRRCKLAIAAKKITSIAEN
jgi:hypothetical protein